MPNNDADAVGGDPARISEIRTKKVVQPRLLEDGEPLIYAWSLPGETEHIPRCSRRQTTCTSSAAASTWRDPRPQRGDDPYGRLYQLGRGVDMAWAVGELVEDEELSGLLATHRGAVHRPSGGDADHPLPCPTGGSLESLLRRHQASLARLRLERAGNTARLLFSQPPKPRFTPVAYESSARRAVYELRDRYDGAEPRASGWSDRVGVPSTSSAIDTTTRSAGPGRSRASGR